MEEVRFQRRPTSALVNRKPCMQSYGQCRMKLFSAHPIPICIVLCCLCTVPYHIRASHASLLTWATYNDCQSETSPSPIRGDSTSISKGGTQLAFHHLTHRRELSF